jgi:hypothetical protein
VLYVLAAILIIAWLLGLVSAYTLGGLIHLLLFIAIALLLIRILGARIG